MTNKLINNSAYPSESLYNALYGDSPDRRFRYELYDNTNGFKTELDCVLNGGSVTYAYNSEIRRTCSFTVVETSNFNQINFITDRVKVVCDVYDRDTDTWISCPLGMFVLSSATRKAGVGVITREVSGYDLAQQLKRYKHKENYSTVVGGNVIQAVRDLLTAANLTSNIEDKGSLFTYTSLFLIGEEYLATINALLGMIGYGSLFFDGNGVACALPYIPPAQRTPELTYQTDETSLIADGAELTLDLFDVPNVIIVTPSSSEASTTIAAAYAYNDNPDSPTSRVATGEERVMKYEMEDVTTSDQAQAKANQYLVENSQVYQEVNFSTSIVPVHGENNTIQFTHDELGDSALYTEQNWSIPLQFDGVMTHTIRRTIAI